MPLRRTGFKKPTMHVCKMKGCKNKIDLVLNFCSDECKKQFFDKRITVARKALNAVSDKRSREMKEYTKLRKQFLLDNPNCQMNFPGLCTGKATDVHHVHRRGKNYLKVDTWAAACRNCHTYVETHPKESREQGWLK